MTAMNPLESLLRPAAAMINRQIGAMTPARELCAELDGRVFAMRVPDTALTALPSGADMDRVRQLAERVTAGVPRGWPQMAAISKRCGAMKRIPDRRDICAKRPPGSTITKTALIG